MAHADANHEQLGKTRLLSRPHAEILRDRFDELRLVRIAQSLYSIEPPAACRVGWVPVGGKRGALHGEQALQITHHE